MAKGQYMDGNAVDVSFMGDDGRSLSPIASVDGEIEVALSTPATYNAFPFERNIPPAFQRAFSGETVVRMIAEFRIDDSRKFAHYNRLERQRIVSGKYHLHTLILLRLWLVL